MSISARAPRQPTAGGGGGRTLLLLGVLLALAAGAIAIFVVSQYSGGGGGQTETVVVTLKDVPTGTLLTTQNINSYFTQKNVTVSSAPPNAYIYSSAAALNTTLNNKVVAETIYQGDYLFNNDQRISPGGGSPGSLTNVNPNAIKAGDVIAQLTVSGQVAVVAGDTVDILATECNLPNNGPGGGTLPCTTQTTLTNVPVYSVNGSTIYLVLSRQKALELKYLAETGTLELAIRNPQDTTSTVTTTPVTGSNIVSSFNF